MLRDLHARLQLPLLPEDRFAQQLIMTISEAARRAQVGVETIRFYEREGLIAQPRKPQRGYRQYGLEHVERIRFLKQCQGFGFSLSEAGKLARMLALGDATCEATCQLAETKLNELRRKIAEYQDLAGKLETLLDSPCRREKNAHCSIVDALCG